MDLISDLSEEETGETTQEGEPQNRKFTKKERLKFQMTSNGIH